MMEKLKAVWAKTNRWHRGLLVFLIVELKLIPGGQLGFTCNDPALSYPFNGDTITWKHLFGTILLLPLAVMLIVERKYHPDKTIKPKQQALRWYKEYLFGVVLNLTVIQTIKLAVGSPRPHFFDTCSPSEAATCQGSEYISSYSCTLKGHWSSQSDRSFPSGHSSLALHAGMFLVYYLHKRATRSKAVLAVEAIFTISAIYCCISRMTDHRHHWWDVLGGVVIGIPILLYTIFILCCDFHTPNLEKESKSDANSCTSHSNKPLLSTEQT